MKKLSFTILFILCAVPFIFSQKIIEEKVEVIGKQTEMKLSFADAITVSAWSNNYIEIQVEVNIDDNQYNDYYSLKIDENRNMLKVVEEVDFDGIKKQKGKQNNCNFNTNINYSLKIPENLNIKLETISGEVELTGCLGEMTINSVSGFIDYAVPQNHEATIDLSTVTGDVYSNLKFDHQEPKKISWVGTNRELMLNGGDIPVNLKTVSGDIYLRKF